MEHIAAVKQLEMDGAQCYAGVRGSPNVSELSDVPREKMSIYEKVWWHPVHSETRVKRTRWVVLRWPHPAMAQSAGMSTEAFADFYFRVCAGVDYAAMARAAEPLAERMRNADQVHLTGPGTDLRFSIKGIGAQPCSGDRNIPDGECFSCPTIDSAEGTVAYNCDTLYRGTVFSGVTLTLKAGVITEATAATPALTAKLNDVLDADAGARRIGEWSLGYNPHVLTPMKDTLFDEKIAGSFHFTPGQAYEEVGNGNESQIHWDMVCIQRPEYGGGEVRFDGELIRRDGLFVPDDLLGLNPDRLGARA